MPIGTNAIGTIAIGASEAAAASPSITDINGDDTILNNETGNTITYADFTNQSGTFTLALRSDSDANASSACSNLSLAAGTGTFDAPNVRDIGETPTLGAPFTTTNNSLEALLTETDVDPDETATIAITRNPESPTYEVVEVLSATKVEGSIFENVTGAIVDESIVYQPTANNTTIDPDGIITTDQTSGTIDFWLWKKDAGTWEQIIFNLGGSVGGASTGGVGYFEDMIQSYITDYIEE